MQVVQTDSRVHAGVALHAACLLVFACCLLDPCRDPAHVAALEVSCLHCLKEVVVLCRYGEPHSVIVTMLLLHCCNMVQDRPEHPVQASKACGYIVHWTPVAAAQLTVTE